MEPRPPVESKVAALTERVANLEDKAAHNEKSHGKFYDRLALLEKGTEMSDTLSDVKYKQLLDSIERVGRQQAEAMTGVHTKIDAFIELAEIRHKEHERRLHDLEDKDNRKILADAQKRDEEKKLSRRHMRNTVIAVIITFFLTLLLNNVFDVISTAILLKGN